MRILIIIPLMMLLFCCKKNNPPAAAIYPDCFNGLTASPYQIINHCARTITTVELDKYKLVSVLLVDDSLNMTTACKTFNITDYPNAIRIQYHTYAHNPDSAYFAYCTDIIPRYLGASTTWNAVSGTVTTSVSVERSQRQRCDTFRLSFKLDNVRFVNSSNQDTTITTLIIKDSKVGNCIPG